MLKGAKTWEQAVEMNDEIISFETEGLFFLIYIFY